MREAAEFAPHESARTSSVPDFLRGFAIIIRFSIPDCS